jgi:hypothetical protein
MPKFQGAAALPKSNVSKNSRAARRFYGLPQTIDLPTGNSAGFELFASEKTISGILAAILRHPQVVS